MRIVLAAALGLLGGCVTEGGGARPDAQVVGRPPAFADAARRCPNFHQVMDRVPFPGEAVAANIQRGEVTLEFGVGAPDHIGRVRVIHASHEVFIDAAVQAARRLHCSPGPMDIVTTVKFDNGGD